MEFNLSDKRKIRYGFGKDLGLYPEIDVKEFIKICEKECCSVCEKVIRKRAGDKLTQKQLSL